MCSVTLVSAVCSVTQVSDVGCSVTQVSNDRLLSDVCIDRHVSAVAVCVCSDRIVPSVVVTSVTTIECHSLEMTVQCQVKIARGLLKWHVVESFLGLLTDARCLQ